MTRVLLAEDDLSISEPLTRALRREGYEIEAVDNGLDALAAGGDGPDLIVLDIGLPGMDGLEVCRRLRAGGVTKPVMILTARAEEVDTVVGLDAGADDYLTKPFRLAELLARARALLRRTGGDQSQPEGEGEFRIDRDARRVFFRGEELTLTTKEFDLLALLYRERGRVVPREQVMAEVWSTNWYGSSKTLDMHISLLRRKLGDDTQNVRYISTVRGVGFRFNDVT